MLQELQKKYYYVKVRDKYEVIKAHDLLSKIEMPIFTDESIIKFIKSGDNVKDNYLIKDTDGWRIQSHFIATDNFVEDLEEDVSCYLRKKDRDNLSVDEKQKCNKLVAKLNKELQSFACLASICYDNSKDLEEVINKFETFNQLVAKRWEQNFTNFKKSEDFNSTFESFLRDNKLNEIL